MNKVNDFGCLLHYSLFIKIFERVGKRGFYKGVRIIL